MRKYDGIVFREIIKRKKRTLFTLLSIIFAVAILVLVGEVNSLTQITSVTNEKFMWGDIHGKIVNVSGAEALKLKQNSLVKDIGYSSKEAYSITKEFEGGMEQRTWEIFYADEEYCNNIINKDFYELEGRFPKNENEVVLVNSSDKNLKIGEKTKVKETDRTIVGFMKTNEEVPGMDYYKILGIENVEKLPKVTANIKLAKEKNMAESIKEIGRNIGVEKVFDRNVGGERPQEEPFIDISVSLIKQLGEKIEFETATIYPNRSSEILQGILIGALIILVYISINISVKDKRKTYSMLKCIGASNGQIRLLILKEGFIVGILSIIPGVILGEMIFLTIKEKLLLIVNEAKVFIEYSLDFKIICIAIIILFIVIIVASLIPMIWVSKLSPIEGIRKNGVKGNKRRIRSKLIRKILGCEGEIAYKNLRADKSSLISLTLMMTIALMIFNVFTSYYKFTLNETEKKLGVIDRDLKIWKYRNLDDSKNIDKILEKYKEYGEVSKINYYDSLLRIQGLEDIVLKDSQAYKYYDEEENIITSINYGVSIISLNDKAFKDLMPYVDGKNINLEAFKNGEVLFFTNKDEGVIHSPKNRDEIKVYINDSDNVYEFENAWEGANEVGKFIVPENEKTIIKDLNLMGTVYLETILGSDVDLGGRFNGIIISEKLAEELDLMRKQEDNYIFEFKSVELREKYMAEIKEDVDKSEEMHYYDSFQDRKEKLDYLNSLAQLIYTILGCIVILMILSIVNIKDIVLNNRKKEFGTMFALGMDKKMLKKSLIYEGLIQGILALIIGNTISISILIFMQEAIKKFTFSYGILLIGSLGIMVICMLNILNSVRRLSPKNAIDLMRNIE
ncbi:FtsX-like permease family protein [uncultured Clostridium sp.]|uniref:ABC transporter permease n=1 Tax=uncultured Clostridium sp. TaxID=59620 RepID=UPI00260E5106|nr:FtsX-like permease family protein [uncultured Clostridium sp.]